MSSIDKSWSAFMAAKDRADAAYAATHPQHDPECDDSFCTTCFPQAAAELPFFVHRCSLGADCTFSGVSGEWTCGATYGPDSEPSPEDWTGPAHPFVAQYHGAAVRCAECSAPRRSLVHGFPR